MSDRFSRVTSRWTLVERFQLIGFIVMILGAVFIGKWISDRIKSSVINQSALETALYLDNFIVPNLQSLSASDSLSAEDVQKLNQLFDETNIGRQVVTVKVWGQTGQILYSNRSDLVGQVFPSSEIDEAWQGVVVTAVSDLKDAENIAEKATYKSLLEIYIPVRENNTQKVIAVAEFYQQVDALEADIASAQKKSWLIVCISILSIYLLLVRFFRTAYEQIEKQDAALEQQVGQLTAILSHNEKLDQRVRQTSANAATLNERILRHLTDELVDGPVQKIKQAILELDPEIVETPVTVSDDPIQKSISNLPNIQTTLQKAVQEALSITGGFGLPHLEKLTVPEIFTSAIQAHEARTGTKVVFQMGKLPEQADLAVKIAAYRIVQEALTNAFRHAGGLGQEVNVTSQANQLHLEISDRGPGFDVNLSTKGEDHLGLAGMRERVASLGGTFLVESKIGVGTKIIVRLNPRTIPVGMAL